MADLKKLTSEPVEIVDEDASRADARKTFRASVQALTVDRGPFAALGDLDDLEMMEAATEFARRR